MPRPRAVLATAPGNEDYTSQLVGCLFSNCDTMCENLPFENRFLTVDAPAFEKLVLNEFPALRGDFEDWEDLLHLKVSEFLCFTQAAIEQESFEIVSKCFEIANAALIEGDDSLRNAMYVSYLEHLDLRSDAGKRAATLMPPELKQGRNDILDYDEHLLGRKLPVDNR